MLFGDLLPWLAATHTTVLEKAQAGERAQQIFTLIVEAKNVYSGIKMFIRYL